MSNLFIKIIRISKIVVVRAKVEAKVAAEAVNAMAVDGKRLDNYRAKLCCWDDIVKTFIQILTGLNPNKTIRFLTSSE